MVATTQAIVSHKYTTTGLGGCHDYLIPGFLELCPDLGPQTRMLDVGCGNGSVAAEFAKSGCRIVGIDMSETGIQIARETCPSGRFEVLPADAQLLQNLTEAPFDVTYSLEVIEHLYDPKTFIAGCFNATRSGGQFICSTPFHGYAKSLFISLVNGWERQHNPGLNGGHIQFFTRKKLFNLLEQTGFRNLRFRGAGRAPYLWKSMLISATKP